MSYAPSQDKIVKSSSATEGPTANNKSTLQCSFTLSGEGQKTSLPQETALNNRYVESQLEDMPLPEPYQDDQKLIKSASKGDFPKEAKKRDGLLTISDSPLKAEKAMQ